MKVQIRGSQGTNFEVEIGSDSTVLALKESIASLRSLDAAKIRLIYSGKILGDNQTLASYGITEGHAIHMVVAGNKTSPKPAAPKPTPQPAAVPPSTVQSDPLPPFTPPPQQQNPFGGANPFGGLGGANPFGGLGGFGGMPDMNQLRSMMQNPVVRNMMNQMMENPEMMREMIQSNPMFANNPMMQQMVNEMTANPEMLRSMMNMMMGGAGPEQAGGAAPGGDIFSQMMQNPEVQRIMNDPAAMQEAMNAMYGGGAGANPFGALFGQPAPAAAQPTAASASATTDKATFYKITGMTETPELNAKLNNPKASRAVRQLIDACRNLRREGVEVFPSVEELASAAAPAAPAAAPQPTISNEERFASQLQQMNEMGLNDNTKNIRALLASNGNVNVAIERIFSGQFN
jgi:ubiquilin